MGSLSCCLLLAMALLTPCAAAARKCDLQGLWRNELGSNMTLSALDASGTFSGSYHTAVAATNKQILVSPLQGAQQHSSDKGQPTFGFTVQWQFAGTGVPSTASRDSRPSPAQAGSGVSPGWSPTPPVAPRNPGCGHGQDTCTRSGHGM
ncbi:avidin-like isoform X1 [Larus michahellis]|uniref:avidin-like isoform X1 n=1 Tax=Larus michahellis TaxID=119627 RepID=UPI003D9B5AF3